MQIINQLITFPEKNYHNKVCLTPFDTIQIGPTGNVSLCGCSGWMPSIIGNILNNTLDEILNSSAAKKIRQSIRDGSYRYCNEKTCGVIANNQLIDLQTLTPDEWMPGWELFNNDAVEKFPTQYFIAGDLTCNLSCPSCRTKIIKNSEFITNKNNQLLDVFNKNIFNKKSDKHINITLSTSGEVFASSLLLSFLINFPLENYPNVNFRIQTNGLLLKNRWDKINKIANNITQIAVTADSSIPSVYEKLRRGGKFEDLEENLKFIANLKRTFQIDFKLRMVVQKDNYDEIEKFYHWGKAFGANGIEYTGIKNWHTYTPDDFKEIDVLNKSHPLYDKTTEQLSKLKETYSDVVFFGFNLD
jgi:MoaA/NifB/PqqE/SkfB family radical SAM enzyme